MKTVILLFVFSVSGLVFGQTKEPSLGDKPLEKRKYEDGMTEEERIKSFREQAKNGKPGGMLGLVNSYYFGEGANQSFSMALEWGKYATAAAAKELDGGSKASFDMKDLWRCYAILAEIYHEGKGVPKNYQYAAAFYSWGAYSGDGFCQLKFSMCYLRGQGVTESNFLAYTWANLAAAEKAVDAEKIRDILERTMSSEDIRKAQAVGTIWLEKAAKPQSVNGFPDPALKRKP